MVTRENRHDKYEIEPQRSLENICEGAQDQRRGITNSGCNRKSARQADEKETALRWTWGTRDIFYSQPWRAEMRAEEVEDALEGA
ncbi:hypothetical protein ElyMa_003988400 [Elysia marginata]|uniref:Uncharacterized protein n=1 Tax=Elysia marginata TaxID=1093978 RepID=A0AAV4FZQ2_9GAST|nr:hypothetical protein ElyMa_003988400 [Elysia marginata]